MGPHPKVVTEACTAGLRRRATPWQISTADFFDDVELLRSLFAGLLGAKADNIAIVPAASYGIACAAKNISVKPTQKILLLADQFPSNYYAWARLADDNDAELCVVETPEDLDWTAAVMKAIATHKDDIAVAALPNHHWSNGAPLDLDVICDALHDIGARITLDLSQTLGACPFDLEAARPDFLVAAGYKWLFCPYGISFLYVADEYFDGVPIEEAWANRTGSDDFARLVDYSNDYQHGARRFDVGERAKFETVPGAIAAIRQVLDWGVNRIAAELDTRNETLAELLGEYGFTVPLRERRGPHFQGLRIPDEVQDSLVREFAARNIFASQRGSSLRIAPHLYNDDEDLQILRAALDHLYGKVK
jgi:selenocysteine lyase/cysteine desulfurase